MALTFARAALIQIIDGGTTTLSDHNRSPFDETIERIESTSTTWNGTRRRFYRGDKRRWRVSWEELPHLDAKTVDGYAGADSLLALYTGSTGDVTIRVTEEDGTTTDYTAHITEFSRELKYRWPEAYFYDVSMSFEEV